MQSKTLISFFSSESTRANPAVKNFARQLIFPTIPHVDVERDSADFLSTASRPTISPTNDKNSSPPTKPMVGLFAPNALVDRNSNLVTRGAIRFQIFGASPHLSADGTQRPGNGLAPAIFRKGRRVFIHEALWLAWMLNYDISEMSMQQAEELVSTMRTKPVANLFHG